MVQTVLAALLLLTLAMPAEAQEKKPPYWASIASGQAMTRTGPGKNYPGVWLYQRRDLPVRVLKRYEHWRLIEDMDGAKGWMLVTLLSDRRTAVVREGAPRAVRVEPSDNAKPRYLAEARAVGQIDHCKSGWCQIAFGTRKGFIRTTDLWGVAAGETFD
jgi:SH3-like domain-containing protein